MLPPRKLDADTILGVIEGDATGIDELTKDVIAGKHRLVLFTSAVVPPDLSRRLGIDLVVTDDFTTAVYRAAFKE
jgi:hypothetical protein